MSNASTIRRQVSGTQQLTIAPLSGTTITTTATAFQLNNNALTLTGGGVIPLSAGVTGLYQGTGQVIWIHAAGTLTGGTASSTTLALTLYEVPAALLPIANTLSGAQTFTNWNSLASTGASGALAAGVTAGNFALDAFVQLDANGDLTGSFEYAIFTSTAGPAATTQAKALVGEQDLNFVLVATLGGTTTGVILNLNEFELSFV